MSATDLEIQWFDEFWESLQEDEDDRLSAVRLIGEMFSEGLIRRDGDRLRAFTPSGGVTLLDLDARDQYLIRRIEEAAREADEIVGRHA